MSKFPYPREDNPYHGIDDDETELEEIREAKRAAFAIECRKVRMWIAANPGSTTPVLKAACGGRADMCLAKMLNMGIIRVDRERLPTGRWCNRWYVVPAEVIKYENLDPIVPIKGNNP